ncbi:hypothetical protein PsYK624_168030 [Phanerochaete sordida]|uniref:Uncharacterized protein n=1 Tax=Phanerochaete sordida TaxID=48140 RepID=A0A9P3LM72_9APHY|nr:hypothetical protein PsYK624_168030 [Phanerochaete sordida]
MHHTAHSTTLARHTSLKVCLELPHGLLPRFLPPSSVHRPLALRAGIHVSPVQLGAASIGDRWEKYGRGSMNKESSFKLLDAFYEAGGNFIDNHVHPLPGPQQRPRPRRGGVHAGRE